MSSDIEPLQKDSLSHSSDGKGPDFQIDASDFGAQAPKSYFPVAIFNKLFPWFDSPQYRNDHCILSSFIQT